MLEELLHFTMHALTAIFFIGMAGSSIVVIISFVDDFKELVGKE